MYAGGADPPPDDFRANPMCASARGPPGDEGVRGVEHEEGQGRRRHQGNRPGFHGNVTLFSGLNTSETQNRPKVSKTHHFM
eukprot:14339103-Alexandrium_andersonii.AAC.1